MPAGTQGKHLITNAKLSVYESIGKFCVPAHHVPRCVRKPVVSASIRRSNRVCRVSNFGEVVTTTRIDIVIPASTRYTETDIIISNVQLGKNIESIIDQTSFLEPEITEVRAWLSTTLICNFGIGILQSPGRRIFNGVVPANPEVAIVFHFKCVSGAKWNDRADDKSGDCGGKRLDFQRCCVTPVMACLTGMMTVIRHSCILSFIFVCETKSTSNTPTHSRGFYPPYGRFSYAGNQSPAD
ncbi:hypothetical protein LT18_00630 [Pseudomonas aeruginosa]|nr:hypothetical protein LT18_00630 [Pseudomonas aeruginosa]